MRWMRWSSGSRAGDELHFDADVASFRLSQQKTGWAIVEHRIGDLRIIRLIQKWLKAGVLENGVVTEVKRGRAGIGNLTAARQRLPHDVFDLWAERWRRHEATAT